MVVTDPIADMLTRIRNALTAKRLQVVIPASKLKKSLAQILLAEGYIKSVEVQKDGINENLVLALKYGAEKQRVIVGLRRISKPGLRVYASSDELPRVLGGMGIAIISTNKGLLTDRDARAAGVGGEVLAYVW